MTRTTYPKEQSLIQVQTTTGDMIGIIAPVGPAIAEHLARQMTSSGFLTIRNDREAISIAADRVVAFRVTLFVEGQPT